MMIILVHEGITHLKEIERGGIPRGDAPLPIEAMRGKAGIFDEERGQTPQVEERGIIGFIFKQLPCQLGE